MESTRSGHGTWTIAAAILGVACLCASVGPASGQTKNVGYSSAADWNLKAENLQPHGVNPYYLPLRPGSKCIMEEPKFSDEGDTGHYRKEVRVLEETEDFDIPSIGGKFRCAIVEEKEFLNGKQFAKSHNYYCIDRVSNNIYVFGETSWESSDRASGAIPDTPSEGWRAGEPDDNGVAEPGLIVPGSIMLGAKYIIAGAEGESFGGARIMESGLTIKTPAGTFDNCVRVREYDLLDPEDYTDKVYCLDIGVVSDTSDGMLVESDALETYTPRRTALVAPQTNGDASARQISDEQAREIALAAVPGVVMDVAVERKLGAKRIVVEVIADADKAETDVIIDMVTGKVLAIEK